MRKSAGRTRSRKVFTAALQQQSTLQAQFLSYMVCVFLIWYMLYLIWYMLYLIIYTCTSYIPSVTVRFPYPFSLLHAVNWEACLVDGPALPHCKQTWARLTRGSRKLMMTRYEQLLWILYTWFYIAEILPFVSDMILKRHQGWYAHPTHLAGPPTQSGVFVLRCPGSRFGRQAVQLLDMKIPSEKNALPIFMLWQRFVKCVACARASQNGENRFEITPFHVSNP